MTGASSEELSLTPDAVALAELLHRELRVRWNDLDADPEEISPAVARPAELPDYTAAPAPAELVGRRAELIVEASDAQAIQAALASGARAVVLDFDDTFSPTVANVRAAYAALPGVMDALAGRAQTLLFRPRALYAVEPHLDFGGPGIASLCDLAAVLSARPERPVPVYIPKLETAAQAQFWDDALGLIERRLGWPRNAVPVCIQIETWSGLMHADELLYTLRHRAYGLNAGRWDYIFSLIKWLAHDAAWRSRPVPTRAELGMQQDSMRAYAETLVRLARRRGAQAIGGSAALTPDPLEPGLVLARVQADKRREAQQGFTAAWAGLPVLLAAVEAGFADVQAAALPPESPAKTLERLLSLPEARLTLEVVQDTIGLALDVFAAWYAGRGVIVRGENIEDTATAELARAQLWQWVGCQAVLETGQRLTPERYLAERRAQRPDGAPESRLLDALVLARQCPPYFPRFAQTLGLVDTALDETALPNGTSLETPS